MGFGNPCDHRQSKSVSVLERACSFEGSNSSFIHNIRFLFKAIHLIIEDECLYEESF